MVKSVRYELRDDIVQEVNLTVLAMPASFDIKDIDAFLKQLVPIVARRIKTAEFHARFIGCRGIPMSDILKVLARPRSIVK